MNNLFQIKNKGNYQLIFRLIFLMVIFGCEIVTGQGNNQKSEKTNLDGELRFGLENASFFKNNEYHGVHVDGYTLTGAWIRPALILSLNNKFEFQAGWHYLKYNGAEKSPVSTPWISARLNLNRNWKMTVGNLDYSVLHQLIQPLWEPERYYTDKPEAGLQFQYKTNNTYFDTWVNWEQFIQKNDPFQEHFTFGSSLNQLLISKNQTTVSFPFQILFFHKGGEIDSSPLHVQTFMNLAAGINIEETTEGFIKKLKLAGYTLFFNDSRKNMGLPITKGSGLFITSVATTKIGGFELIYFKGNDFYALKGMKLLQSGSDSNPGIWINKRNLLSVNYIIRKEVLTGIIAGFKAEGWFDLKTGDFSNAGSVYILLNQEFLLKRFRSFKT